MTVVVDPDELEEDFEGRRVVRTGWTILSKAGGMEVAGWVVTDEGVVASCHKSRLAALPKEVGVRSPPPPPP